MTQAGNELQCADDNNYFTSLITNTNDAQVTSDLKTNTHIFKILLINIITIRIGK